MIVTEAVREGVAVAVESSNGVSADVAVGVRDPEPFKVGTSVAVKLAVAVPGAAEGVREAEGLAVGSRSVGEGVAVAVGTSVSTTVDVGCAKAASNPTRTGKSAAEMTPSPLTSASWHSVPAKTASASA